MKKTYKYLCVMLTFVLVLTSAYTVSYGDVKNEKSKLSGLNAQKKKATAQKEELKKSKADAEEYVQSVDNQLSDLSTQIYDTEKEMSTTKNKITKAKSQLKESEESIKVQYKEMKLRIKYMYENGDTQMLDLILNSKSISDFLNKAEYITELSQYDRKMITKMQTTKKRIADSKTSLEQNQQSLASIQEQQKNDKTKLQKLSAAKKKEMKSYDSLIKSSEASEQDIESEISAQEAKIAQAEQESIAAAKKAAANTAKKEEQAAVSNNSNNGSSSSSSNHGSSSGGYTWPCPGQTYISSDYGDSEDRSSPHKGIDIAAPSGSSIVATASGTVAWACYSSSAGNWVGISHGNGVVSIYMHMSALLTSEGAHVNKGEQIGLVGTTGMSTGNHLHFEIHKNGIAVSPWTYVSY